MQKREAILEEARRWIRTPYLHQHAIIGHGADCWTFPTSVGIACGVLALEPERFAPFRAYSRQPEPTVVRKMARTFFVRIRKGTQQPGDLALIQWRPGQTVHFAMLGQFKGRATIIHALDRKGGVVEHGFSAEWPTLVHSWWRFPGLEP